MAGNMDTNKTKKNKLIEEPNDPVLIVGVGASAGGLSAFRELLANTPAQTGMALVLIPHLDPKHKSMMEELLADKTAMPICQASNGLKVEANKVYILPAGKGLNISRGELQLVALETPTYRWTAIDQFLRSLAVDQRERAVGIILSGTGSHGSQGVKEIKLAGGLVLAQTIETSQYPQMPENAINTGMVDLVLAPADMPAALIDYTQHSYLSQQTVDAEIAPEQINPILNVLRSRTRFDFRNYRQNMLVRRIHRRMSLCHLDSLEQYQQYLRDTPEEVNNLNKDLLIGVTAFFRDPEAFHVLEQRVVSTLVERSDENTPVRVWVPACSSGEEAYSIAILLLEGFAAANKTPNIQVFATDIDEDALAVARQGVYPESIVNDVSVARLKRFFVKAGEDKYRVTQQLRDVLVFASQSVISDAPFSQLDLISCRNMLIYLLPEMQAKVIQLFHFALKDNAYLLLGPSESMGRQSASFSVLSKKWRLFQRLQLHRRSLADIPIGGATQSLRSTHRETSAITSSSSKANFGELTLKMLLMDYAPASVLVNRNYQILQFYGPTTHYLELPNGEPTHDLISMLRKGLTSRVRSVAHRAWQEQQLVADNNARVSREGHYVHCRIIARPVPHSSDADKLLLISFEDRDLQQSVSVPEAETAETVEEQRIVEQLEYELKATREDLQSNFEELESSNEELKAANEEMMSMNEELQSANEELETSKEELQSMNEELNTVNTELQAKVEELESSHDDISNLLASTDIATIFLDREMRIKLFNPPTADLLHLRESDIDRPISDFSGRVNNDHFSTDAQKVLDKLASVERVVSSQLTNSDDADMRNYLRRMVPYRATNDRIGGVVVTFVDITERYQLEQELEQRVLERTQQLQSSREQLSLVLNAAGAAVWEIDADQQRTLLWEDIHSRLFGDPPESTTDTWDWWLQRVHPEQRQSVEKSLIQAMAGDELRWEQQYQFAMAGGDYHWLSDIAHITRHSDGSFLRITGALIDINQRRLTELALAEREQRLSAIMEYSAEALIVADRNGFITDHNLVAEQVFGYSAEELTGLPISQLVPERFRQKIEQRMEAYLLTGDTALMNQRSDHFGLRKDGTTFPLQVTVTHVKQFGLFVGLIRDLSEHRLLEEEVSNISTWEQERTGRELHDGLGQRLTGLTMLTTHVKNRLLELELEEVNLVQDIIAELKGAAEEVSRISHGLAPISITPGGLADALAILIAKVGDAAAVECSFQNQSTVIISNQQAANQIFRIAQEAFNNALKYAGAKHISITLDEIDDVVELCISDDGIGFDMEELMSYDGFGIRIMHYRANSVGATLSIDTAPGKGTHICCCYHYQGFPDSNQGN